MYRITEISRRLSSLLGCLILQLIGRNRFYFYAQKNNFFSGVCRVFANDIHVKKVVRGFIDINDSLYTERQSLASIKLYSNPSLGGFGDSVITGKGDSHLPLTEQLRFIILPALESLIDDLGEGATICELGVANGDVLAYLADKYPKNHFVGVDFIVGNTIKNHSFQNLKFMPGYALDLLDEGKLNNVDVIYGSSTFLCMGPRELANYLKAMSNASVKNIIVSEPLTRNYDPKNHPFPTSIHMEVNYWGHNYAQVFRDFGFQVFVDNRVKFPGHSKRDNLMFQVCGCHITS